MNIKVMNFQRQSRIAQQKRWKIMAMMWNIIQTIQKKANLITSFSLQSNFYRKYRNTSLAILNNFETKSEAIRTSKQYQVPLMHIQIATSQQQDCIWKYILNCFQNSQILNQGFILWVQFHPKYTEQKKNGQQNYQYAQREQVTGTVQTYYNQMVYKKLRIKQLPQNEEQINQLLNNLRTQYYQLNDQQDVGHDKGKIQDNGVQKYKQEIKDRDGQEQQQKKHNEQVQNWSKKEMIKIQRNKNEVNQCQQQKKRNKLQKIDKASDEKQNSPQKNKQQEDQQN